MNKLEEAARQCLAVSRRSTNVWLSLVAHDCAIHIRDLAGWHPTEPLDEALWMHFELPIQRAYQRLLDVLIAVEDGATEGGTEEQQEARRRAFGDVLRAAKEALPPREQS
jgi:hypothetical protein